MLPLSPKKDIDWENISQTHCIPVNGHIEARFSLSAGTWSSPTFISGTDISISGLSPGLNYGQQCYEGMKAFRTGGKRDRILIFRPEFHANRMADSAASVCLPPPPRELFHECVRKAVVENAEYIPPADSASFLYIRPLLFGSSTGLWGLCDEVTFAVFVQPARPNYERKALKALVSEEFDKSAPLGMGRYKVGGNYAPVWRHVGKASKMGYDIVLHLDSATHSYVEEFSTSAFLGHKMTPDGQHVLVVPEAENAMDSTTSKSLALLAKQEGWIVETAQLPILLIKSLDEVVACGTAACAVPIESIERLSTGDKFTFSVSHEAWNLTRLANKLNDIQRGKLDDAEGWCWDVLGVVENNSEVTG
ncbi:branched-chain-amino-acid aminotransferase [Periconia macrospinosa]|uniref:Branched-chain-amino-acid aminotransferase n=1 Tax=Periconia macrospinosa TaxID=97972 RepID=A0A2V1E5B4_9PLEO|nr:branched-chain-amino-acid aminotransferase [Periconia macrospinosa]